MFEKKGRQQMDVAPVTLETLVKLIGGNAQSINLGYGD
jgi:hypothetical protein